MTPQEMRLKHPKITNAALLRMSVLNMFNLAQIHTTNVLTWWSVFADAVTEAYWLELQKQYDR